MDGNLAGEAPVEQPVRPVAWMVRQGSRTYYVSDAEFVRSSYDSGEFVPLYGLEALAAERERCAHVCRGIAAGHAGTARRLTNDVHSAHAAGQRDGAHECAAAILKA